MKVFIIAEAGVNHNGSIEIAKKMIDAAVDAGADAVKFQTFKADQLVCRHAPKAEYQKINSAADESQFNMIQKLELSPKDHMVLMEYCRNKQITFLSSPFDLDSIDILSDLGMKLFKIPSGEITNLQYLRKIGRLRKRVILSSGMSDLGEIEKALDVLEEGGTVKDDITVLHCNTEYPTPIKDVNLRAMCTIRYAFPGINVGYSDHTLGIEVPVAAVALGASVIEKHFTLDKSLPGPDQKASLEPAVLKQMVRSIRNIEIAMGNGVKRPSPSELKNRIIARKSIVASANIQVGERFTQMNIAAKRPGTGISPMRWDEVIGKKSGKKYSKDDLIDA